MSRPLAPVPACPSRRLELPRPRDGCVRGLLAAAGGLATEESRRRERNDLFLGPVPWRWALSCATKSRSRVRLGTGLPEVLSLGKHQKLEENPGVVTRCVWRQSSGSRFSHVCAF